MLRITSLAFARDRFAGFLVRTASDVCSGQERLTRTSQIPLIWLRPARAPRSQGKRIIERSHCSLPPHSAAVQKPPPRRS